MLRVLVIGARRQRQGIGEFVTRFLAQAGASVCGVIGTSEASARQASANLEQYGIRAASYTDLATALRQERPDVVAICSPFHVHRQQLEMVATEGCHCLCEKPLWWNDTPPAGAGGDRAARRPLRSTWTLSCPRCSVALYITGILPSLSLSSRVWPSKSLRCIWVRFSCGPGMVLDAAPHLLSMLQQMLGCGHVSDAVAKYLYADERDLCLEFTYVHDSGAARVRCRLTTTEDAATTGPPTESTESSSNDSLSCHNTISVSSRQNRSSLLLALSRQRNARSQSRTL